MRPGGSSTSEDRAVGLDAGAGARSSAAEPAEPLDDDVALADQPRRRWKACAPRRCRLTTTNGPWPPVPVDGRPSVSARSETGTGCRRRQIDRRPSACARSSALARPGRATTRCSGRANRWPPASTSRHGSTARVIGTMMRNSLPAPGVGAHLDPAAGRLDAGAHDVEPDPPAGDVGDERRGGRAPDGRSAGAVSSSVSPSASMPEPGRLGAHPVDVDAPAVVADGDDDLGPELHGVQPHRAPGPACRPRSRSAGVRCRGRRRCGPGAAASRRADAARHGRARCPRLDLPAHVLAQAAGDVAHGALQLSR